MYQLCKNIIDNTYESFIRIFKWMESFKRYRTIKGKLFVIGSIFHFYLKRLTGSHLLFLLPSKNYKLYNLRRSDRQRLQQEVEPVYLVTRHDHPRLLISFFITLTMEQLKLTQSTQKRRNFSNESNMDE